jgi:uncharacterized protein Yka (UPF0111/DUF47 family)
VAGLKLKQWFLPETPDVLGMLREQVAVTVEGMEALVGWAHGDASRAEVVRECEHRADEHKRAIRLALTTAFTTPLEAEDLFVLSGELDAVLNGAKDAVRESEVMMLAPDRATAEMAELLLEGVRHLDEAFDCLPSDRRAATEAADAAMKSQRQVEKVYRRAMGQLLEVDDLREVMARRELYRRLARLADGLIDVAERVWYAVVKEA